MRLFFYIVEIVYFGFVSYIVEIAHFGFVFYIVEIAHFGFVSYNYSENSAFLVCFFT